MNLFDSPFQTLIVYHSDFDPTESKIRSFSSYQNGWHYHEGIAFSKASVDDALILHRQIFFKGFTRTNAFPGPNGEIQITMYHKNHYFAFEREASGLWNITHEVDGEEVESLQQKNFDEVVSYVNALDSKICDIFDVFSKIIGTSTTKGSRSMPFGDTAMGFLSSTRTACLTAAQQSVLT